MAKKYKLMRNGVVIYPCSTTDAIVNPNTKKTVTEETNELKNKSIKLYAFSSAVGGLLEVGQIGYSTSQKRLFKKVSDDGRVETVSFIEGAIYLWNDDIYTWNGTDLVIGNSITSLTQSIKDAQKSVDDAQKSLDLFLSDKNKVVKNIVWESGCYASDGTIASGQSHTDVELSGEDKTLITNARSIAPLYCVFFDVNGDVISVFNNYNESPSIIDIPEGASKVGISNFSLTNPTDSVYIIVNPLSISEFEKEINDNTQIKLDGKLDKEYTNLIKVKELERTWQSVSGGNRIYSFDVSLTEAIIIDRFTAPGSISIYYTDSNDSNVGDSINADKIYEGGNLYKPEGAVKLNIKVYYTADMPVVYSANTEIIKIAEELIALKEKVEGDNSVILNNYSIYNIVIPTYESASGNRTYRFEYAEAKSFFFEKCSFKTSSGEDGGTATIRFYKSDDTEIINESVVELQGYINLPDECAYMTVRCYYTSIIGKCYLADKYQKIVSEAIKDNYNNIIEVNKKIDDLSVVYNQYDDGAYYTFEDKTVGENQTGKSYDLGKADTLFAGGMPEIIVKDGGYIDGADLESGVFYLTLKMKKRCSYCAATIISKGVEETSGDGVLIIVDEKSRDGVTTQFHRRILHILLPNISNNSVFSIQLGDYDKAEDGSPRWNYEYSETTIVELYSDIEASPEYAGKKNLWEVFVEDEMLYIFLNGKLVKVYKNVSAESPNVANFAFNDLIPNADRAEVENCKVVDFCIGTKKHTYGMFASLYNAKKLLGL
jgi:hypothetical protein